jgi:poly-gamma-glutamate synthesis protein (capsule biosynthesis protein)
MRILVAGDFFPARRLAGLAETDPGALFGSFAETIQDADLAVLNLEAPLCEPHQAIAKTGPNLHANPETAAFLANAGFQLATLANNHIFDFGQLGLESTMAALDRFGVDYVGAGSNLDEAQKPYLAEFDKSKIAILNFAENEWSTTRGESAGACPIDAVANYHAIRNAKIHADHVIVICHGGHEKYNLPSPRMKQLYRFYVDAGASAVVNHHTHCMSGFEVYRGAPIFYSLGNFLFDSPSLRSGDWTKGMAVELILSDAAPGYEIHFFDQCSNDTLFQLCDDKQKDDRLEYLDTLNLIISDDRQLQNSYQSYSDQQTQRYMRYLEPVKSRVLSAAQSRGWVPSLLTRRQKQLLLNIIRCEAHRDLVLEILERDVGLACRSDSPQAVDDE